MDGKTVYSTGLGRVCPECGKEKSSCICKSKSLEVHPTCIAKQGVKVSRETKGRKGKGVTVISGLSMSYDEISNLARFLKQRCASGGTVTDERIIEIQGDHRDIIVKLLSDKGINAKKSGG